ncbi:MAG: phosphatase PAP2 family protein [Armatimonadetes bacterium]|nr:phosphatase PAP2 family protein [Armatimonadota bacterium]
MPDLAALDRELFQAVHIGWHHDWLDKPFLLVTYTGDGWQLVPLLLSLAKKDWRPVTLPAVASYLLAGAIRLVMIQFIHRDRPSNLAFAHPLEPIYNNSSFPSGHTTTTWAIAMAVVLFCSGSRAAWIRTGFVLWAVAVALSRVYIGVHYPADVVGGAALGAMGAGLVRLFWPTVNPQVQETETGGTG